ncbi:MULTISPECIES: metalloregulator ArsR/SmtB family transcription factor [Caballeronia]|uniref:Winged helix-turn-helix transcriptional regulator n=1 Tax=Caballeronia novacaledonica TaxID=1544861 RepID=A0AA37I9X9_9BURK|nr:MULTISPECIES: metalloregulator ArsR/SmtB family transcription factor [Caballeronia]KAK47045.1 ArsR family transcriptional regulator [Caballeronia jiangsuensis]MDR5743557.1 metalloregulator ArsR/SmtB family transcription factor [Caballeronia sp. LZ029]GJH25832.1 winged helix-turn-helix transcriptional regulator [Caballeronia novacaledonica]
MSAEIELSDDQVVELAEMFRLMGDPSRLKIIAACLGAPMCVSDIAAKYGMSQPLVSHHLRLLRAARVLRSERRGKQIFYEAADHHVKRVIGNMVEHVCEQPSPEAADIDDATRQE